MYDFVDEWMGGLRDDLNHNVKKPKKINLCSKVLRSKSKLVVNVSYKEQKQLHFHRAELFSQNSKSSQNSSKSTLMTHTQNRSFEELRGSLV